MRQAVAGLKLDLLYLVYQGKHQLQLEEKIALLPVDKIVEADLKIK
jgi:hypothetical protein